MPYPVNRLISLVGRSSVVARCGRGQCPTPATAIIDWAEHLGEGFDFSMISSPIQMRRVQQIPIMATPFVGRQAELDELHRLLTHPGVRLITILGAGGIGKTRLAFEAALRHRELFPDGVSLVTLSSPTNADEFALLIAETVDFQTQPGDQSPADQVLEHVKSRTLLLILENAEYLADAVIFVGSLVEHAPNVKLLATSRQKLNLSAESVFPLGGMDLPTAAAEVDVFASGGVRLFLDSAIRAQPGFDLSPADLEAVVRICQLAQGMPLAILLAASWLPLLSPAEIAQEMEQNLNILQTDLRDVPERQRSIRAVFDASWKLLDADEQRVLLRLAVFTNGFTRDAAEQVARADLHMLMNLFNKSLVQRLVSTARYDLHELLRQYTLERLRQSDDETAAYAAHSRYYLHLAAQLTPQITGRGQLDALDRVEADFDNIRAAWIWAVEHDELENVGRALDSIYWYGMMRSRYSALEAFFAQIQLALRPDGIAGQLSPQIEVRSRWMRRWRAGAPSNPNTIDELEALLITLPEESVDRVLGLILLGDALDATGSDPARAERMLSSAYELATRLHEDFYAAWGLHFQARQAARRFGIEQGLALGRRAADLRRGRGDLIGACYSLYNVSMDLLLAGRSEESAQAATEQLELSRKMRECSSILMSQITLSLHALLDARFEQAQMYADASAKLAADLNHTLGIAWTNLIRGLLVWFDGDFDGAFELLSESVDTATHDTVRFFLDWGFALTARPGAENRHAHRVRALSYAAKIRADGAMRLCLPAWALAEAGSGNAHKAAALLGLTDGVGAWLSHWLEVTALPPQLERIIGAEAFDVAYAKGKVWELETTVRTLLSERRGDGTGESDLADRVRRANEQLIEPLSERELEVIGSIASGLSNREIADQLVVELSTVKKHLTHIYGKLDVLNRAQAILRAQQLGLV